MNLKILGEKLAFDLVIKVQKIFGNLIYGRNLKISLFIVLKTLCSKFFIVFYLFIIFSENLISSRDVEVKITEIRWHPRFLMDGPIE